MKMMMKMMMKDDDDDDDDDEWCKLTVGNASGSWSWTCTYIKPAFCICENNDADQLRSNRAVTAKLISAFVFATPIVQSLYFLNLKFQDSSHLMLLYSPVCVGPGQKPRRQVFSQ